MATGTVDFSKIAPSAQASAEMTKDFFPDLPWAYLESYPRPPQDRTVQVRSEMPERTRRATVKKYVADMKNGEKFPPLFVSQDGWVLDGLHRRDALEARGIASFHVIMIKRNYQNAPTALKDQFTLLVAKLNQRNGDKMTRKEVEALVASLSGENSPTDVAKITGVGTSAVKDIMNAQKARVRARNLDLDASGISRTTLKHVGLRLPELTEPVFKELIPLLQKTPITTAETVAVLDKLAAAPTESKKLALLHTERESRSAQEKGVRTIRTPAQNARMHWAFFLQHADDPSVLVETNGAKSGDHTTEGWQVISILRKVMQAQTNLDADGLPVPVKE